MERTETDTQNDKVCSDGILENYDMVPYIIFYLISRLLHDYWAGFNHQPFHGRASVRRRSMWTSCKTLELTPLCFIQRDVKLCTRKVTNKGMIMRRVVTTRRADQSKLQPKDLYGSSASPPLVFFMISLF